MAFSSRSVACDRAHLRPVGIVLVRAAQARPEIQQLPLQVSDLLTRKRGCAEAWIAFRPRAMTGRAGGIDLLPGGRERTDAHEARHQARRESRHPARPHQHFEFPRRRLHLRPACSQRVAFNHRARAPRKARQWLFIRSTIRANPPQGQVDAFPDRSGGLRHRVNIAAESPAISNRSPCARSSVHAALRERRCRNLKRRVAPKDTDAMAGSRPSSGSSSACQPMPSRPSRYRLSSTLL